MSRKKTNALTDEECRWISVAADRYGLPGEPSVERISALDPISRCHIFRLGCGQDQFALKVYPQGWWADRLHRAHHAAEFLKECGFPSPRPLRTDAGDRVLFLGERAAICSTWIPGYSIWDPLTEEWQQEEQIGTLLLSEMKQLAVFHDAMSRFPEEPTRIREFPSMDWFSERLQTARQLVVSSEAAIQEHLSGLQKILSGNSFDEAFSCQHCLVDCHPGQFLYDGTIFTGIVDFDHVATSARFRDICKFLSTDPITLTRSPELVDAYLGVGDLPSEERMCLPAGTLRYIVTSVINGTHKALAQKQSLDGVVQSFSVKLEAFYGAVQDLAAALDIDDMPAVPNKPGAN